MWSASIIFWTTSLTCLARSYKIAVIEYEPNELTIEENPLEYIFSNVKNIENLMLEIEADLVLLPEYALTSTQILGHEKFDQFAQEVPLHKFKPCQGHEIFWSVFDHISCIAFRFKIYLVINIVTRNHGSIFER